MKVFDGSPNDDNEDHQNAANSDYAKSSPSYDNEEESNYRVKRCATDDENGEEICDEEEISDTHQLTQVNTLGENENTEKITSNEETEKMEEESCSKQKSKVQNMKHNIRVNNFF